MQDFFACFWLGVCEDWKFGWFFIWDLGFKIWDLEEGVLDGGLEKF